MKFLSWILLLASIVTLSACSSETHELKSPCVGTEGSPCGTKRPVNDWWLS
jgi:hypothetical protein